MYKPLTGNETDKVRARIVTYLKGFGVDLGCGENPIMPRNAKSVTYNCLGVDTGTLNADIIHDVSKLPMFSDESLDFVYSSHCLEDFTYWQEVVREWWRLVKVEGRLIIYCPLTKGVAKNMGLENWRDFYPDMDDESDPDRNPCHRTDLNPVELRDYIVGLSPAEIEVDEIRNTKEDDEYSFLLIIRKIGSIGLNPKEYFQRKKNGHSKRALVIRYGAFGDCVMTTPVLSVLKKQGYEVHLNTTPYGADVFKYNPNIDKILLQERNSVPVTDLPKEIAEYEKQYDRVINLCGAVEDKLLVPDYAAFNIMNGIRQKCTEKVTDKEIFLKVIQTFRKQFGDKNYYDSHLEKAGLDERGLNGELYFSGIEEKMAHDFLRQNQGRYIVLWSLSGSAFHKIYPYFYQAVQGILNQVPDALVVSVGDMQCRIMEPPPSGRFIPRSGDWPVRMSLLMTKYADLVIGPETGILNGAGCFDTPKITLRSHSSHDNLCKYWENDFCMEPDPERVPCFPCHMLHYSDETCLTAPLVNPQIGKYVEPTAEDKEFNHPLCVSWGVRPEQIVSKAVELRERFGLRNPRPPYGHRQTSEVIAHA